jgi:hypothetical protein
MRRCCVEVTVDRRISGVECSWPEPQQDYTKPKLSTRSGVRALAIRLWYLYITTLIFRFANTWIKCVGLSQEIVPY